MLKKVTIFSLIFLFALVLYADTAAIANEALANDPSVIAEVVNRTKGWLVGFLLSYKTSLLLLVLAFILEPLFSKYIGGLYEKWLRFSKKIAEKQPKMQDLLLLVDKLVLAQTGALMGVAAKFKEAAKDGKLTDLEKDYLKNEVRVQVLKALKDAYPEMGQTAITIILKYIEAAIPWKVDLHKGKPLSPTKLTTDS